MSKPFGATVAVVSWALLLMNSGGVVAAPTEKAGGVSSAPAGSDSVSSQLRTILIEARAKLGDLEPWQKKIFDDEVLSQSKRFIRDYRQTGTKISAEVDLDVLASYLRFYGPKAVKFQNRNVLVLLKADPGCERCKASEGAMKELAKSRLERRGLVPVWVRGEDAGPAKVRGNVLDALLSDLVRSKGAAGALALQWGPVPEDDIDSAHLDETRYLVHAFLTLRDFDKQNDELEIMETDTFDSAAGRLLTDMFTSLGKKVVLATQASRSGPQKELLVEVSGFRNFQHFQKIKDLLASYIKNVSVIEERKITKGKVGLAVISDESRDEVIKQISQAAKDPAIGTAVKMEVQ